MAGKKRATAKQTVNRVKKASANKILVTPNDSTTSRVEGGDASNGGPRLAAALLSLGQDLTQGEAATALGESSTNAVPVQNPLEIMATSKISMTPLDAKAGPKKRKRRKSHAEKQDDGNPTDFWHWLPPGDNVGNWDVLCGRGGESNHFIGNKKYRKYVGEKKEEYRKIDVKQRKQKTDFVKAIVQHIKNYGGRFVDVTIQGKYYVVTDEKARKKTSQALRETKVLKWLVESYDDVGKEDETKRKVARNKDVVCPFCKKKGHKTRIAKACLRHHEWLDMNTSSTAKAAIIKDTANETKGNLLAV